MSWVKERFSPKSKHEETIALILDFIRIDLYVCFLNDDNTVERMMNQLNNEFATDLRWKKEIRNLDIQLKQDLMELKRMFHNGGMKEMPNKESVKIVQNKLYDNLLLKEPIKILKLVSKSDPQQQELEQLKEQITKGNRANFKLLQEVIQGINEVAESLSNPQVKEQLQADAKQMQQTVASYVASLVNMFDLIDLIRNAVEQNGDQTWKRSLDSAVFNAINIMSEHDIEEIVVKGQLFDGKLMEGIGTVSQHEIADPSLEKYAVYAVVQRGFKYRNTNELIRKAKVITVY